jgi:hypothetical protein
MTHGLLRVTGVTLPGPRETDSFDIAAAPGGDVSLALLDVETKAWETRSTPSALLDRAMRGLAERTPLQVVMLDLARELLGFPAPLLRVTLMRCSAASARVEVTTAGMPPVVCIGPDGTVALHAGPWPALKAASPAPPPVEVVPLVWGSTWCLLSDGFTSGATDAERTHHVARELALPARAAALSSRSPAGLCEAFPAVEGADRTCVLLAADTPSRLGHH